MLTIGALLGALELEADGPGRYRAGNTGDGPGTIFGGRLLAQTIVAASRAQERGAKRVKTVQTVFARAGRADAPVDITVEPIHDGRAFASATVTIAQGDRRCARSLVLLTADEPDFIAHADPAPPAALAPPEGDGTGAHGEGGDWRIQVVGDVDVSDPDRVGPPELDVWTRFAGAPDDPVVAQALLAYATDGFLIGTAMRPHAGVGQAQAHVTVQTGVVGHTLTFHEPFPADGWLLLAQRSPYAGRGRSYGRGDVFRPGGALVASFVQDAMIRPVPGTQEGTDG